VRSCLPYLWLGACLAIVGCAAKPAGPPTHQPRTPLTQTLPTLEVVGDGWGSGSRRDIAAVYRSAAQQFWPAGTTRQLHIRVAHSTKGPIVLYRLDPDGATRVLINSKGQFWAQHAFQIAHELCHILCRYKDADKSNLWFEETLCEVASLYTLRRMAKTWPTKAPYPNWKSFAPKLASYAKDRIDRHPLPPGHSLASWYQQHAQQFRKNATDRKLNTTAAVQLLSLFEQHPSGWLTLTHINTARTGKPQTFSDYLADWHHHCSPEQRPFVQKMAGQFGIVLKDLP
jgi:hypothetical protein